MLNSPVKRVVQPAAWKTHPGFFALQSEKAETVQNKIQHKFFAPIIPQSPVVTLLKTFFDKKIAVDLVIGVFSGGSSENASFENDPVENTLAHSCQKRSFLIFGCVMSQ